MNLSIAGFYISLNSNNEVGAKNGSMETVYQHHSQQKQLYKVYSVFPFFIHTHIFPLTFGLNIVQHF